MAKPREGVRDGYRSGVPSPTYTAGILWIALNERTDEMSLAGMKYSAAVILLGHLFGKTSNEVAQDVISLRKRGADGEEKNKDVRRVRYT